MGLDFSADFYRKEPELWLANQTGHMAGGASAVVLICGAWFWITGEFPYKSVVFAFLAIFYIVRVELIGQGWKGWDTVEDTIFFSGYGGGVVLYSFREIVPGSTEFIGDLMDVLPFLIVAYIHLALGILWRIRNKSRSERE